MKPKKVSNYIIGTFAVSVLTLLLVGIILQKMPGEKTEQFACPIPASITTGTIDRLNISGINNLTIEYSPGVELWSTISEEKTLQHLDFSFTDGVLTLKDNGTKSDRIQKLRLGLPRFPGKLAIDKSEARIAGFEVDTAWVTLSDSAKFTADSCSFSKIFIEADGSSLANLQHTKTGCLDVNLTKSQVNVYQNSMMQQLSGMLDQKSGLWIYTYCPEILVKSDSTSWLHYR